MQQRTVRLLYRILVDRNGNYSWATRYGALVALCEMGTKVISMKFIDESTFDCFKIISQLICPILKPLSEQIQSLENRTMIKRITETILVKNEFHQRTNKFDENSL